MRHDPNEDGNYDSSHYDGDDVHLQQTIDWKLGLFIKQN